VCSGRVVVRAYHLAIRPSFGAALDAVAAVAAVAATVATIKGAAAREALKEGAGWCVAVAMKRRAVVVGARGDMLKWIVGRGECIGLGDVLGSPWEVCYVLGGFSMAAESMRGGVGMG
jgi:hypothetical protein